MIRISHLKCDVCILVYPGNNLWSVTTLTLTHIDANQPLCRQFLRPDTSEGMSSNWSALSGPQGFVRVHSESSHIQKQCLKWVASRPSNKEYCQKKNTRLLLRLYMSTKNCQIRPPSSKCLLLPKVDTSSRAALAGASIPWCFVVFYPNHETRTLHQGMAAFEHENSFHRNLLKSGFANSLSSSKEKGVTIFACSSWWKEMGGKSWLPPVPFGRHLSSRMTYGKPPRLHLFEWSHHTDLGKWRALRKGFFDLKSQLKQKWKAW